nr:unnamed protein product [Callosobruchus chinensis]
MCAERRLQSHPTNYKRDTSRLQKL